jgi:hypothetical protein
VLFAASFSLGSRRFILSFVETTSIIVITRHLHRKVLVRARTDQSRAYLDLSLSKNHADETLTVQGCHLSVFISVADACG